MELDTKAISIDSRKSEVVLVSINSRVAPLVEAVALRTDTGSVALRTKALVLA